MIFSPTEFHVDKKRQVIQMNENTTEKLSRLAREIMTLSRNQLLVNLRFLDAALSRLELTENPQIPLATDGRLLLYDPRVILSRYREDRFATARDYLHIVFHCIYRHMFVHTLVDHAVWDLACDIATEYSITGLGIKAVSASREAGQPGVIRELQKEIGQLTAEKIYRYYLDKRLTPKELQNLQALFRADEHEIWYMPDSEKHAFGLPGFARVGSELGEAINRVSVGLTLTGSEEDWQNISQSIQTDIETFVKRQGRDPAAMLQNLREVNRERYDYTAFLRRFAVRGEVMKVDPDEFDYIFYTYGLELYGNIPLIEPLEYREVNRIREFVIAIDTSGSVAGEIVQRFVQKTWNILKSTESFFSRINLHIIQCDATIQEDAKITNEEEAEAYIRDMKIRGLGGTDFRPVFGYVQWLREKKEFTNLRGLIYFTDGWGTFPENMPDYQTAFVFLDEDYNNYDIPSWAMKLVLKTEEI